MSKLGGIETLLAIGGTEVLELQREVARALRNMACDAVALAALIDSGAITYFVTKAPLINPA